MQCGNNRRINPLIEITFTNTFEHSTHSISFQSIQYNPIQFDCQRGYSFKTKTDPVADEVNNVHRYFIFPHNY